MIFEFSNAKGQVLAVERRIGHAPKYLVRGGMRFERVPGRFSTTAAVRPNLGERYYHKAYSCPTWWPFAERYDERGHPLFATKSEVVEAQARAQGAGETVVFDA